MKHSTFETKVLGKLEGFGSLGYYEVLAEVAEVGGVFAEDGVTYFANSIHPSTQSTCCGYWLEI